MRINNGLHLVQNKLFFSFMDFSLSSLSLPQSQETLADIFLSMIILIKIKS